MAGLLFRMFRVDKTEVRGTMQGEQLQLEIEDFRTELAMQILNLEYFKDKMLLMQAQENGVVLDEEQLLFIAGGQTNTFNDDVDEAPVQDLALNEDVFQADLCDAFDSDVDEAPDMAHLVQDHDNYLDSVDEYQEVHEIHNDVQQNYVVDSDAEYTSDSNIILKGKGFRTNKGILPYEVIPFFKTLKEYFEGIQTALVKEVKEMKEIFEQMEAEVEQMLWTSNDAPEFDSFFKINKMKAKDNTIRNLKVQISQMNERHSEADRILDIKALDSQNTELTEKITRARTIEKTTSLLTENEKLKAQLKGKIKCVIMNVVKPKVLAHGVNSSTESSMSKSRSNTKNNRILLAKSNNKKKVEAHPRNNKSNLKQKNRVDFSISSKRTCVVKYLKSWKPTGRKFTLGEQYPLTRFTKSKVVPLQQLGHVSFSEIVITERFSNTSQKPLTRYIRRNKQEKAISNGISTTAETQSMDASMNYTTVVHIMLWYLDSGCSKHMMGNRSRLKNFVKKFIGTVRFENDHFGAIMGYGDYVVGDSVIFRVYYVEGLGHNLFSVRQFCDSDLEVAFRKHSYYVRDIDGVELLKGCHGLNLYTISVEDMMKSSPICLLSKASKNM
ncbi:hypothetical protein Tco_1092961 [Tanacetum coccineum]|uniref:Retrovirus-related Pol polyprotein from transposon TNT 1-94-like beta-barrel domain-containing protein n=1 Tax=Tanacetum coccineum TaxID=301880 RepID=A0ABQ5IBB4_9ASTR